jgi:hypothetical protein
MHICRIILSSVVCLAPPYFSTLSHKRHDFKKKRYWTKMCVLIFSTTFVCNISHYKKDWVRHLSWMYMALHVKYPLSFSNFYKTSIFSTDVRKIPKHQISWKFTLWQPSCSMQTDVMRLIITFHSFANMPSYVLFSMCTDQWLLIVTSGAKKATYFQNILQLYTMLPHTAHYALHNRPKVESLCTDH